MERGIVDANWGLNGEDEENLWDEWKVDSSDDIEMTEGDVVAKGGDDGQPPSVREVRLVAGELTP